MTIEVGVLISVMALALAFLGYKLNKTREVKAEGGNSAKIETRLEYISKGVDDIRIDLRANERQMVAYGERLTRVEESAKQAHKRIDYFEGGKE